MKEIINLSQFLVLIFIISCGVKSENTDTNSASQVFAELSEKEGFAEKHEEPLEVNEELRGEMLKIKVENGEAANAYLMKNEGSDNYLLLIHEWWGLNDHIKLEADNWFEKLGNTNVMALDLYDGKLATTREKAKEYMQGADEKRINNILNAVLGELPEQANVATMGWCFGGGWSLKTALAAGSKTQACVMYYGMPVKSVDQLKALNSDVLFIYGVEDKWINKKVAEEFEIAMQEADKEVEVLSFEADHAFANPSSKHFEEKAAKEANQKAYDYLSSRLNN